MPAVEEDEDIDLTAGRHTKSVRLKNLADRDAAEIAVYLKAGMTGEEVIDTFLLKRGDKGVAATIPTPAGPSELEQTQTRLAEVTTKLTEIAGQEGYFTPEANALILERQDLTTKAALLERQERAQAINAEQQAQQQFDAVVEESLTASYNAYPQLENPQDPLSVEVDALLEEAIANPRHKYHNALANNPQAPLLAATLVATAKGIAPVVKTIAAAAPAATPPASSPQPTPAVPAVQATPPSPGPGLPPVAGNRGTAVQVDPNGVVAAAQFQNDLAAAKSEDEISALLEQDLYSGAKPNTAWTFRG